MNDFLYKKYSQKSTAELRYVVTNPKDYIDEAVQCASGILEERRQAALAHASAMPTGKNVQKATAVYDFSDEPFADLLKNFRIFLANYSAGEFLNLLTLSIFYVALFKVLDYLAGGGIVGSPRLIQVVVFILLMALSHVLYKKEHGRRNRFLGRLVQDFALFFFTYTFMFGVQSFLYSAAFDYSFSVALPILVLVLMMEFFLSLVSMGVKAVLWEIW